MYPLVEIVVAKLDPALLEEFEERAAIIEYDAKIPRDDAEYLALIEVLQRHPELALK